MHAQVVLGHTGVVAQAGGAGVAGAGGDLGEAIAHDGFLGGRCAGNLALCGNRRPLHRAGKCVCGKRNVMQATAGKTIGAARFAAMK
ncbi:hypothetical protein D9M69_726010 [compost metagenome]